MIWLFLCYFIAFHANSRERFRAQFFEFWVVLLTQIRHSLKSALDKKASSIVYGLHFLQVWPSLNIAYEPLMQIQTDVCIE